MVRRVPASQRHFLGFIKDAINAVSNVLKGVGILPKNTTSIQVVPVTTGGAPAGLSASPGMPAWLLPALVGVGVLVIVLLVARRRS